MMTRRLSASALVRANGAVEPLEVRVLPTVTASLSRGTLNLLGDASANDITIERSGSDLVLTGNNGTLIRFNGENVAQATISGARHLNGAFGLLGDTITFESGVALGNVSLNLGSGANSVDFGDSTFTGKLTVNGGVNGDSVTFDGTALNSVSLNLLDGDNEVDFLGATFNGIISIKTGSGIDTITAAEGTGGVDNTFRGAVTIRTSAGADSINLADSTFANLTIDSEANNDDVVLDTVTVNGRLVISGGEGDDAISLTAVIQTGNGTNSITGLAGVDAILLKGAAFNSAVSIDLGTGTANQLEIDDVDFARSATFLSKGVNDALRIEQDTTLNGPTDFFGAVSIQMGAGATVGLGINDPVASFIQTRSSLTIKGSTPNLIATLVLIRSDLRLPPVLKNAQLVVV